MIQGRSFILALAWVVVVVTAHSVPSKQGEGTSIQQFTLYDSVKKIFESTGLKLSFWRDDDEGKNCSDNSPCPNGKFCNFQYGEEGYCEKCSEIGDDCYNNGLPIAGADQCAEKCDLPDSDDEEEEDDDEDEDDGYGAKCARKTPCPDDQFCNFDMGKFGGFCERCSDVNNCYRAGLPPAGADECAAICETMIW